MKIPVHIRYEKSFYIGEVDIENLDEYYQKAKDLCSSSGWLPPKNLIVNKDEWNIEIGY